VKSVNDLIDVLLLFRLSRRPLDVLLTSATTALLIWSRFAYLANGPWEWDETLFARGILHFELAAHFPHPPGFPGWLAIGHALMPVAGDPLLALQLASAAFSVIALWLLTSLGRRVAPPPVAVGAALVVLVAPGPWLYAVRGFSTTAAAVLALGAAVVAAGGLEGRRVTAFSLLVTASFLVRPNLLPVLAVLWIGVGWSVRPWRRLLPGVVAGSTLTALAVFLMARAEGGWAAFVAPFITHSERHFSRLVGNAGGYADLGLVKGLGGVAPATVLFTAATLGIVVWARRVGKRTALLWAVVLVTAVAQLVWMQNRTTGRYAVGVQMALAPLVAGAAATAPVTVGCVGLLGLAAWLGYDSLPLVAEQRRTQLPAWIAVQEARSDALLSGRTVVLEPELHPYASYLWHLLEWRGEENPPWMLSPWDPGQWTGVDGPWVVATVHRHLYPGPLRGKERHWGGVSDRLRPLTQNRFLNAWVIEDTPMPLSDWWPAERESNGRKFMWGGVEAVMVLPPLGEDTQLGIALRPAPGPAPVVIEINGREMARVDGEAGEQRLWLRIPPAAVDKVAELRFTRAAAFPPGGEDQRPLALQLYELRAFSPAGPWTGPVAHPWQRDAIKVELEGAYGAEEFAGAGEGVWLGARGVLRAPAGEGRLRFRLWAPRPTPARTVLFVAGRRATGPLDIGQKPAFFDVEVLGSEAEGGRVEVEIVSDPYTPANNGGADRRELGVVLSEIAFEPGN